MPEQKEKLGDKSRLDRASQSESNADAATTLGVIELHDLRTGPDAEFRRIEGQVIGLGQEISQLRGENQRLMAANQKLDAELRDVKMLLSKVQITELRRLEKVSTWLRR